MLTIFNTNELSRAVEIAELRVDTVQYITLNSPAAQELIKHIWRQKVVSGYLCLIGGAEWCKLGFNALPCCLTTSSISVEAPLLPLQKWPHMPLLTDQLETASHAKPYHHISMLIAHIFKSNSKTLV